MNALSTQPPRGAVATTLLTVESLELLRREEVGRICLHVNGYPVALPINYVVDETIDGPRIVIRTAPSTMIGTYHGRASLEVDRVDLVAGRAWSVIVHGKLTALEAGRRPNEAPRPFVSDERTRWMELTVVSVTGRTFAAHRSGFYVDWQLDLPTPKALYAATRTARA